MEDAKPEGGAPPAPKKGRAGLWIGVAIVVIVVAILLAAVFGGLFAPAVAEDRVLRIGTVLSLTGTSGLEVFGPSNQKGATLAVEEINAAGGVLGRPIEMVNEDDNGVTATSVARAQKLITTNHVDAILGAVGSGKCAAVLEVAKPNQVVQVSASCTSPIFTNLTLTEGWFFRTAPSDALQGVVAANYAFTDRGFRTMAVIGNNNPYGIGLANVFATKFRALGGTAKVGVFPEAGTSYTSELTALFSPVPEAVYMAEYPTDGLNVMRDWKANSAWTSIKWLFSEGVLDQAGFVDKLVTQGVDPTPFQGSAPGAYLGVVGANYDAFLTRYHTRYGATADPGLFTANAYDAIYIIAAAAQRAGTATGPGIKGQLGAISNPPGTVVTVGEWSKILTEIGAGRDINYEGAGGAANIDPFGDPLSGYGIWGVNATTKKITTLKLYTEAQVLGLLGATLAYASSVPAWASSVATVPMKREWT